MREREGGKVGSVSRARGAPSSARKVPGSRLPHARVSADRQIDKEGER